MKSLLPFWLILVVASAANVLASEMKGPLRRHPTNPRYFTDDSGKAIYLTGSHTWGTLVDSGPMDPPPAFDYAVYLDLLERYNHNFIRLWTQELFKEGESGGDADPIGNSAPHPWQRTGPGTAWDGKPRFDLEQFNPAYFDRLRERVIAARDRGIYVGIMLFKGEFAPKSGRGHPFYRDNNVNNINADLNGDGLITEVHTLQLPAVTNLQKAYIAKVIDCTNDLDNVLYEISNESKRASAEWHHHLIDYIHAYEAGKPKKHPVGMTCFYDNGNTPLFASSAEWISPGDEPPADYSNDPPAADGRKVILLDTDHLAAANNFMVPLTGADHGWVWKSFLRGHNPIFMDSLEPLASNDGVQRLLKKQKGQRAEVLDIAESRRESARRAMGDTRRYARRLNLAATTPRPELTSTKYCLANPGKEYLVYQPKAGNAFSVDLNTGKYRYEWFKPATGETAARGELCSSGGTQHFQAPFEADAVLYLKAE